MRIRFFLNEHFWQTIKTDYNYSYRQIWRLIARYSFSHYDPKKILNMLIIFFSYILEVLYSIPYSCKAQKNKNWPNVIKSSQIIQYAIMKLLGPHDNVLQKIKIKVIWQINGTVNIWVTIINCYFLVRICIATHRMEQCDG